MIRQTIKTDIEHIYNISKSCAAALRGQNIYQWNEHYPTKSIFENDVLRGESYCYVEQEKVIGSIVLTELMDEEYFPIQWLTSNKNNLYLHRLAIDPVYWGKGYAQKLMKFAEKYAADSNYQSIRLDTFSQNNRNIKFYESRGYQRLGSIYFPKQSPYPFFCYELLL